MDGRKSYEEMKRVVESCQSSGMSNKSYCKQAGIPLSKYYYWQKKLREDQEKPADKFIPIEIGEAGSHPHQIEISYPNGVRLKLPQGSPLTLISSLIRLS